MAEHRVLSQKAVLAVGAGLEDLGKGLRSQVGTMYGTLAKGPRYLRDGRGICNRYRS